jgi:hypothetical protein
VLTGNNSFNRKLRNFSRLEPVDVSPIPPAEAQEFFYALQGCWV